MSFQIKSLATIRIFVNNVQESKNWYQSLFGQKPIEEIENFVSFKISNVCFDISLADSKSPFSSGGSVGYWLIDDIDKLLERVEKIGGKIYRGPLRVEEVQRIIVQIQDPFGNVIGFEAPF